MLTKKQYIDSYIITFPIKEGPYAETSRVKDSEGKTSLEQTSSGWTFNLDALNDTVNETKDGVE